MCLFYKDKRIFEEIENSNFNEVETHLKDIGTITVGFLGTCILLFICTFSSFPFLKNKLFYLVVIISIFLLIFIYLQRKQVNEELEKNRGRKLTV